MVPAFPSPSGKAAARRPCGILYLLAAIALLIVGLVALIVCLAVVGDSSEAASDAQTRNGTQEDFVYMHSTSNGTKVVTGLRPPPMISGKGTGLTSHVATTTVSTELSPSSEATEADENSAEITVESNPEESSTTATSSSTSPSPTTLASSSSAPSSTPSPIRDHSAEVKACAAVAIRPTSCSQLPRRAAAPTATFSDKLELLAYHLNLTATFQSDVLQGSAEVFLQPIVAIDQITFDAGASLRGLAEQLFVVNCVTRETLCVTTQQDTQKEVLSINLPALTTDPLRVSFGNYHAITPTAVFRRTSEQWNSALATVQGSMMDGYEDARHICPSLPEQRAPMTICVQHPSSAHATANTRVSVVDRTDAAMTRSCFLPTPPLPAHHFAFFTHQKTESMFYNATATLPEVEIIFSYVHNFANTKDKHNWIYREVSKVLGKLSSWFSYPYPLPRLTLIAAPIKTPPMASALGHLVIVEANLENPSWPKTHLQLLRALVSQYFGGVVSGPECVEEAITSYFEWRTNDALKLTLSASTEEKVSESRPMNLNEQRKHMAARSRISVLPTVPTRCSDRLPSIFHTLDELFGNTTSQEVAQKMLSRFSFRVTQLGDWSATVEEVTGSLSAGAMFSAWFTQPHRPLFSAITESSGVTFTQLTGHLWSLPIEIGGSQGIEKVELLPLAQQTIPFTSDSYVIVDPKRISTALVLYDANSYHRILRCASDSSCPSTPEQIRSIFADFGAFFSADRVEPPTSEQETHSWRTLLIHLYDQKMLKGDGACCAAHAIGRPSVDRNCIWKIRDVCEGIRLSKALLGRK